MAGCANLGRPAGAAHGRILGRFGLTISCVCRSPRFRVGVLGLVQGWLSGDLDRDWNWVDLWVR